MTHHAAPLSSSEDEATPGAPQPSVWLTMFTAAAAGGMGWGIRGQYGHETGAMIAGVLVSLVLVLRLAPAAALLPAARAVALGTVAMGFGGSMTYGQTIGLTQNAPVIGNLSALAWGMLGLAVKGGLWIGFAGLFLGLGLGNQRVRWREMAGLAVALVGLFFIGIWLFNTPLDPVSRQLPALYFSADWHWEPANDSLRPRPEVWGGMALAWLGGWGWLGLVRGERLARNLAVWGVLGGAIGFPLGQCLQAGHAWNPAWFADGPFAALDPYMNWWNWMETTFGAVMAAVLALGLHRNRHLIGLPQASPTSPQQSAGGDLALPAELLVLAAHLMLLVLCEVVEMPPFNQVYDHGLVAGVLPLVAVVGGRASPFLMMLPITLLPITLKTVTLLTAHAGGGEASLASWGMACVLPMTLATGLAVWLIRRAADRVAAARPLAFSLILTTLTYFLLNQAVFQFPWPWLEWTGRTPNGIAFTLATAVVVSAATTVLVRGSPAQLLDSREPDRQD